MSILIERVHRLHVDLQHLLVLTFPRTQEMYRKYLELCKRGLLSQKLKTHPVYSEKFVDYLDVPTYVMYTDTKYTRILCKEWRNSIGFLHREGDLPALVWWHVNGKVWIQEWYKEGKYHREGGLPSIVTYDDDGQIYYQLWHKHGKMHREGDLPSYQIWYDNGQLACQEWWKDGQMHRDSDLPALQKWDKKGTLVCEEWWEKDVRIK